MRTEASHGPFDPDELVRWAESYGDPEWWCKRAQQLHGENERLRGVLKEVRAQWAYPKLVALVDEALRRDV